MNACHSLDASNSSDASNNSNANNKQRNIIIANNSRNESNRAANKKWTPEKARMLAK